MKHSLTWPPDFSAALSRSSAGERRRARRAQQFFRVFADVAFPENGVAGNQQLRPCMHNIAHGIERHTAIDFNSKRQAERFADFHKRSDFLERAGNKLLCPESRV